MGLRGELELRRKLVAEAGRGGGKLNALARLLLCALTSCPFASFVVKLCYNKVIQAPRRDRFSGIRPPPLWQPNRGFQTSDLSAGPASEPNLPVIRGFPPVLSLLGPNYLPVTVPFRVRGQF